MEAVVGSEHVNNEKWSLRQKIVGIIINPRQTFEYLVNKPDWITPLVFIALSSIFLAVVTMPLMPAELKRQIPENVRNIGMFFGVTFAPIQSIVSFLIICTIFHVLGRAMLRIVDFKQVMSGLGYAYFPLIFKTLILTLSTAFSGKIVISRGLSDFFSNSLLKLIAGSIDIFVAWNLFLTAIALQKFYNYSKRIVVLIVGGIWAAPILVQYLLK